MAATMPAIPNKDDLVATYVFLPQALVQQPTSNTECEANSDIRWSYLEQGVEQIMSRLREGVDMKTYMGIYTCV